MKRFLHHLCANDPPVSSLGDDFLYDVVARANEAAVENVESADLGLLTMLAAVVAVLVFGIDKSDEHSSRWQLLACALLAASGCCCVIGYLIGAYNTRQTINPVRFTTDFADDPRATAAVATYGAAHACAVNIRDRTWKKASISVAFALFVLGLIAVAMSRVHTGV